MSTRMRTVYVCVLRSCELELFLLNKRHARDLNGFMKHNDSGGRTLSHTTRRIMMNSSPLEAKVRGSSTAYGGRTDFCGSKHIPVKRTADGWAWGVRIQVFHIQGVYNVGRAVVRTLVFISFIEWRGS